VSALEELMALRSWRLHKISPATYGPDLEDRARPGAPDRVPLPFRARVGRGGWHYGPDIESACRLALDHVYGSLVH